MTLDFEQVRHPDYRRFAARWKMAADFWRGGIWVLKPDHKPTTISWLEQVAAAARDEGADGEPAQVDAQTTKYQWHTGQADSYLFKHIRELPQEYGDRCARAYNLPVFQYCVNKLAAGVLAEKPVRNADGPWADIYADIDLAGSDIDTFTRRALSLALVFGRVHAVVDLPQERPATAADEPRAYVTLATPLDIVDWAVDSRGQLLWVVIRESPDDNRLPGETEQRDKPAWNYRVWTRDAWALYRQRSRDERGDGNFVSIGQGKHPLGRVPIASLYCTRVAEAAAMDCETPLPDVLDLNRHLMNELSELNETDRAQAFDLLAIPTPDGLPLGDLAIGLYKYLAYPAGAGGAPSYLSPNPAHPEGRWKRTSEKINVARQLAASSRGKAEYSKEERSAASLAMESRDTINQLAWWAQSVNQFDTDMSRLIADWMGIGAPQRAAFNTDFERKDDLVEVQEILQLVQVPVMQRARAAQSALIGPLVRKKLRDRGADDAAIDAAVSDIELAAAEPEPEPEPPAFGQEEDDDGAA